MNIVFMAFANQEDQPLPSLSDEDAQIYQYLAPGIKTGFYNVHRDSHTNTGQLLDHLILFRDQIILFYYSGHAGQGTLKLEDQTANGMGVADLLAQCPKLKLIILNGCSTHDQVEHLLKLESCPVIIATNALIGDRTAHAFATRFFEVLALDYVSIEEAFTIGLAAAQTLAETDLSPKKGLATRQEDKPLWGIFYRSELNLDWRLPDIPMVSAPQHYQPNSYLINHLLESFTNVNNECSSIYNDSLNGIDRSILDKREAILKSLPYPISEQLRKLVVKEQSDSGHKFYDQINHDRVQQIVNTYNTLLEMFAYILLSQLWDEIERRDSLDLIAEIPEKIRSFLLISRRERPVFNWLPLIKEVFDFFLRRDISFFIKELSSKQDFLEEHSAFSTACRFMETLKRRLRKMGRAKMTLEQAAPVCMIGEEKLAIIVGELDFLLLYTLASVKEIGVIKYKHIKSAQFKHRVVRLVQRFVGLAEENEMREGFMDTASVILVPRDPKEKKYLNLSPFIIDQNAFIEKANVSKVHFFDRYERSMDVYTFKHIYKPEDLPMVVNKESHFQIIKAQFEAFSEAIFKEKPSAL